MTVAIYENVEILANSLVTLILSIYQTSIQQRNIFYLAISGGSLPLILKNDVVVERFWNNPLVDLNKMHIFLVDERCVPSDHEDSNYKAISEIYQNIPNIHGLDSCGGNNSQLAADYEREMKTQFGCKVNEDGFPVFDLILLGMGPDGHTASLFPNHSFNMNHWVSFIDNSPKKPSCRITMTLPVLNAADSVVFVVTGYEKKDMVKSIIVDKRLDVPAGMVKPKNLYWMIDRLAGLEIASHQ